MIYIFVLLIILSLTIPRMSVVNYAIIIFLGWLSVTRINAADFISYENIYYVISPQRLYETGYGWYVLNNWGRSLNLTFAQFKGLLTVIGLILILITCQNFLSKNSNLVLGLYLLYPALINVVQIRFFFASSIVIFSLIFLKKENVINLIIFALLVGVGITIHTSVAFYLVFLLIPIIEKNEKIFSWIVIVGTILLMPFKNFIQNTISIFANDRQLSYLDGSQVGSNMTVLITIILIIVFYLLSNQINTVIQKNDDYDIKEKQVSKLINNINLCFLLLIPAILISSEFARVQRISWILMYIEISMIYMRQKNIKLGKYIISTKFLGAVLGSIGFLVMIVYLAPLALSTVLFD